MDRSSPLTNRSSAEPREDWLRTGVLSGFLATFAMTIALLVAYALANSIGNATGNVLQRWCWALVHNPVAERTADGVMLAIGANLVVGLLLALAYARFLEPMLDGPGWWRGVRFSLIPWLLSLIFFLPLMGGGVFGIDVGAGPLPIIGNLVLHLVYGVVLGEVYADPASEWLDDTQVDRDNAAGAERGAAIGVAIGLPAGFVVGWLLAPAIGDLAGQPETAFGLALVGAAVGLSIGSFAGMGRTRPPSVGQAARR
jgi:hypothetical protein